MSLVALIYGVQDWSREELGVSRQQWRDIKKVSPEWMKGNFVGPKHLLLPWRDMHGRLQFVDMTYILPWGDVGETGSTGLPNVMPIFGSPMMSLVEMGQNKSQFTGRELYNPNTDTAAEVAGKLSLHLWRFLAPSLAPGGWGFSKLAAAAFPSAEGDYFGRQRSLPAAISSTLFGLKITAIDPVQEAGRRQWEFDKASREIEAALNSLGRDRSLSHKQKEKQVRKLQKKHRQLVENFRTR